MSLGAIYASGLISLRINLEQAKIMHAILFLRTSLFFLYIPLVSSATAEEKGKYETAKYEAVLTEGAFEIRNYPEIVVASAPMEASPDDLEGQLAYMIERWIGLLPGWLKDRLLMAQGVLREETQMRGGGPGPPQVGFYRGDVEFEAFTPDRDWMSNVVLLAKQTHVWLDQLSKAYGRSIKRLDQVPDDELDRLARWGFTGLWLIGVWERSVASSEIKRRMGNPEAIASAYSLYDYVVSEDLGGELSYDNLSRRANARGIRLAADMVPNHVGIYSKWVIEHPDWFIQLDHPPYPGYQFNGADLSWNPDVEVRIVHPEHFDADLIELAVPAALSFLLAEVRP